MTDTYSRQHNRTRSATHAGHVTTPGAIEATMRALIQDAYGSPDVIKAATVPLPTPPARGRCGSGLRPPR